MSRKSGQCSTDRSHNKNNSSADFNNTLHKRFNSNEQLQSKITQLSRLKPKDLPAISDSLQDMVHTLSKVTFNEIQHHQLLRENEQMKTEIAQFRAQQIKLYATIGQLQKDNQTLMEKLRFLEDEKLGLKRKIQIEVKQNEELAKKLKRYEQRVQIILESNITLQKDQTKITLIETMHENEQYKMEALQKQKDLQKLQINNSNLSHKLNRLTNRMVSSQRQQTESEFIDQDKMVITFTNIPTNFIFRHVFQNNDCKAFITTSLDQTPEQFCSHFNMIPQEQKKLHLTWLFNHMVNYREFSQQHNNIIIKLTELITIKYRVQYHRSYQELYQFVQNLNHFMKVKKIVLWLRDYWTGFHETLIEGASVKIMCSKGGFRDCLEQREAVNKLTAQKQLLYQDGKGDDVYQENTYIYPLITETVLPAGILEIYHPTASNSYSDIQYFASIIGTFVKLAVQKIEDEVVKQNVAQQKDILIIQFLNLMKAKDKQHFSILTKEMQQRFLQISTCEIIFIENDSMWKYDNKIRSINCITGVCGMIATQQKPAFFSSLIKQVQFNQLIDIYTLAPVYVFPIVHNEQSLAVIELTLTNKQIDRHRFRDPLVSLNQQSNQARMFCESVQTAYICKFAGL